MPATGKSRVTEKQRAKIAAGRLAGKTAKTIAAETGLSKQTIDKQAVDPRTGALIMKLKARDGDLLDEGWKLGLKSILSDLKSKKPVQRRGARRDLLRFLTAGDPAVSKIVPEEPGGKYTLTELLTMYRDFQFRNDE